MIISSILLSVYLSKMSDQKSACQFTRKTEDIFLLHIGSQNLEIPVIEKNAKLEKCTEWTEFPKHYIAEINLGTSGTNAKTTSVYLYILRETEKGLIAVFKKNIRETVSETNAKTGKTSEETKEHPYKLERSKEKKPAIFWVSENTLDIIN